MTLTDRLASVPDAWTPPPLPETLPGGDMPGDRLKIGEEHVCKASLLFPLLCRALRDLGREKAVISVFGGSGVGKSEIAALLGWYFRAAGVGSYVLSGDNYPRRIPAYNDAERLRVFRAEGLKGLLRSGAYSPQVQAYLDALWPDGLDADPRKADEYPWLEVYQAAGRDALRAYLGTEAEQDYEELNAILRAFHRGDSPLWLKRMGRTEEARWYDAVDFREIGVLFVEWTHGGNPLLEGTDLSVLLHSTPEETREHRRSRGRDGKTDSAFTTMVLEIEQEELLRAAPRADWILSKAGKLISARDVTEG